MGRLEDTTKEGKMLIQNLSKIDFQDKNLDDNILNLIIIYFFLLAICDREREKEKKALSWHAVVSSPQCGGHTAFSSSFPIGGICG